MTESNTASSLLAPFIENLYRMAWIVEARDPYTGGHLWRVSQYCRQLAQDLGLDADEVARIELGCFLHDLGKVGVPDAVLNKPGPLDDHEYALIKTHPRIGARPPAGGACAGGGVDAPRDARWTRLSGRAQRRRHSPDRTHCGPLSQVRFKFRTDEAIELEPTGAKGSAEQLETEVDEALLTALVAGAHQHLAPRYKGLLDGAR